MTGEIVFLGFTLRDLPTPLVNYRVSPHSVSLTLATEDAKAAAEVVKTFLTSLDLEPSKAKNWEKLFEEGLR